MSGKQHFAQGMDISNIMLGLLVSQMPLQFSNTWTT
jgi:hypothetical protein